MKPIVKQFLQKVAVSAQAANRDWEDRNLMLNAKILMAQESWQSRIKEDLAEKEFRVYSQWGDDGIIQYLIKSLEVINPSFIEFGVGNYYESNTHFLLVNDQWQGFVIDGSKENIEDLKKSPIYWRYTIDAVDAFITRDNINHILAKSPFCTPGILHIDLDGNDYWIFKALEERFLPSDILILEYNGLFGKEKSVTIPYNENFVRSQAHWSWLYYGASLPALAQLAETRGFFFIGCNSAGNNAYFLANKHLGKISKESVIDGFREPHFREGRSKDGSLSYLSAEKAKRLLQGLTVVDPINEQQIIIGK